MSLLNIGGKTPALSSNVTITDNLFVKEGEPANQAPMVKLHKGAELSPNTLTIRGNAFWNWTPEGESSLVVDPLLERVKKGDRLLYLSDQSPVRAASMGDLSTPDQSQKPSPTPLDSTD